MRLVVKCVCQNDAPVFTICILALTVMCLMGVETRDNNRVESDIALE